MRSINEIGAQLVRSFEGFSATPYLCPAGYWTIGYGHVIRAGETFTTITQDEAERLLVEDLSKAELAVCRLCPVALTDDQFAALVDFTFNLGSGALQRSRLRAVVNRGDHDEVPEELFRWVYAGGQKLLGLIRRRTAEALLYGREASDATI